jgi:hypothetical protein
LAVAAGLDDFFARQAEEAAAAGLAADEFGELLAVAHGDPAEEGEVFVGVGELGAEIGAKHEGGDRLGGVGAGGREIKKVGEDFVGVR